MIGLGNTLIPHVADSSFPSDHLTLLWAVALSFLMHQRPRFAGVFLALLGLPMAWARIYLGVHFLLDMLGAALVAGISAWLCFREEKWFVAPLSLGRPLFTVEFLRRLFDGDGCANEALRPP